ncbi:unnamed protein product [Trifolium pratense]|uniref:Uncharacterized protein n=1 Tax=Trifolium pratense TaxID=57577 RepID=A0ACB0MEB8_TRIPR|nr:unnamed protein product [Trifolium pratense]
MAEDWMDVPESAIGCCFLQSAAFMEVIHSAIGSERSVVSSDAMDRKGSVCGPGVTFRFITSLAWSIAECESAGEIGKACHASSAFDTQQFGI